MGPTTQGLGRPRTCPQAARGLPRIAPRPVAAGHARHPTRAAAIVGLLALAGVLAGCGANMRAAVGTARMALDGGAAHVQALTALDARHDYLRVQVGRQVGLMVRADTGAWPGDRTTYWYSADGALLRLVDGRLVGLADGSRSWRAAQDLEAIDWAGVARKGPIEFRRTVDQQPGYRVGQLQRRRLGVAAGGPAGHTLQHTAARLQWFTERDALDEHSSVAWYAVDLEAVPPRVVYGQACLAADWCISWQPWPPTGRAS